MNTTTTTTEHNPISDGVLKKTDVRNVIQQWRHYFQNDPPIAIDEPVCEEKVPYVDHVKRLKQTEISDDFPLALKVQEALKHDNRDEFVNLINSISCEEDAVRISKEVWIYIFQYDSVECTRSIICDKNKTKTKGRFDLLGNLSEVEFRSTPLHEAARFAAFRIIGLYLDLGHSADTRIDYDKFNLKAALPLNVALTHIRPALLQYFKLDPRPSAFKLIVHHCACLPPKYLQSVRLLAKKTKEIHQVVDNCLRAGQIVELSALLMAGCRPAFTSLLQLEDQEMVQLLNIFDRIGDKIAAYVDLKQARLWRFDTVVMDITSLFKDVGLHVTSNEIKEAYTLFSFLGLDGPQKKQMFEGESPEEQLQAYTRGDCKLKFTSFLRKLLQKENSGCSSCSISHSELWKSICLHRAVGCASALLQREVGLCMDLNATLECGMYPLQLAAQRLSSGLTKLLLEYGANPNLCCGLDLPDLPLSLALKALCLRKTVRQWAPEKSVFLLICIYMLRQLSEPLDTIKLLALRTAEVEKICLQCVSEAEPVQLAALLMTAWEKLMTPFMRHGIQCTPLGQHILKELQIVSQQLSDCSCKHELVLLNERKTRLNAAWEVLRILEENYALLDTYRTATPEGLEINPELPYTIYSMLGGPISDEITDTDLFHPDVKCALLWNTSEAIVFKFTPLDVFKEP